MDLLLKDKVALVCGASQGIGYSVAAEISREGAKVIICSRNEERIHMAAQQIETETGRPVVAFRTDLAEKADIESLAETALGLYGRLDILVNNTGGPPPGFYHELDYEQWMAAYKSTCMSAIHLSSLILPGMKKNHWGRIINLTSLTVKQPIHNLILSNSIRMGVIGWAKTIALEYAPYGVTVNNIATGYTSTERMQEIIKKRMVAEAISETEALSSIVNHIPMKRMARPEEIAYLVTFLVSPKADYITGTTMSIDGGVVQYTLA